VSAFVRSARNPILSRSDVPEVAPRLRDVTSVFNPGAVRVGDETVLVVRVQTRGRETVLMVARGRDGGDFAVEPFIVELPGIEAVGETIYHVYDPRITPIDGDYYLTLALDTYDECRMGFARTRDFASFEFLGVTDDGDVRNGVLFPEKIGGRFARLSRPNRIQPNGGPPTGDEIVYSQSDDLLHWDTPVPVMKGRPRYWDERIGSGPPPIRTKDGWLHVYHGIATHFGSVNIYQAGVVLLAPDDPTRVVARGRDNVLEPREPFELVGQVPNVVFPSGMTVERADAAGFAPRDAVVHLYYGAADTCVCAATSTVARLVDACRE